MTTYGFTYNGVSSSTYNMTVQNTITGMLPPVVGRTIAVPKRPGAYYNRTDLGPRWIQVQVAITQDTNVDLRTQIRQIAAWLTTANGPQALVFDNEPGMTYYAVLDEGGGGGSGSQSTDIDQLVSLGQGTLTFMCPDPFAYETQTSLAFSNDSASPNVSGTYETYPTIDVTFTAASTNFSVALGNSVITINHTFAANDTLTIDCAKHLIQINGQNAMADLDISSDFFALQPGTQTVTTSPTGVSNATIYWTPRWL